eukprot:m.59307 g.59307  ORF g.59307 m.59307 type:complete len:76 (+) comp11764_c0_seq1:132-359(+)
MCDMVVHAQKVIQQTSKQQNCSMELCRSRLESLEAGDGTSKDQCVDVVCAFICVNCLQVDEVAHDMVLTGNTITS